MGGLGSQPVLLVDKMQLTVGQLPPMCEMNALFPSVDHSVLRGAGSRGSALRNPHTRERSRESQVGWEEGQSGIEDSGHSKEQTGHMPILGREQTVQMLLPLFTCVRGADVGYDGGKREMRAEVTRSLERF